MKSLFIVSILFFSFAVVSAQANQDSLPEQQNVKLMSRIRNAVVELRWYPTNYAAWRKANLFGYTVKRIDLGNTAATNEAVVLATVKPFTPDEFRQQLNMNDKMVKGTMDLINNKPISKSILEMDNVENENFVMFTLATSLSADAAKGAGLIFNDDKIEKGKEYAYLVSINDNKGRSQKADETLVIVSNTTSTYTAPTPQDVTIEQGEGFVKLLWNNTSNRALFSAYNIMRSADKGKSYSKINTLPFLSMAKNADTLYFTDSVQNYIPYQYQIVGYTPWVDLSNPSETVYGMGVDRTGAAAPINVKAKGDRSNIILSWDLPNQSGDLKGFTVGRSQNLEGPFTAINPSLIAVSGRSFTDKTPSPKEPFYAVYSVDTANNLSSTFSVMASIYDTTGPAKPLALQGFIDSTGLVNLNWKFGNDNDLLGYQVYMANGKDNIYRQITSSPLVDSVITDTVTMRSLTEEVYYKITAVDYNNNASEYSEILTVKRPDIIPPAAPVIIRYQVVKNAANIAWAISQSTDVIKHAVYRIEEGKAEMLLKEFRATTSSLNDETISAGKNYTYIVKAFDDAGLVSASEPLSISTAEESEMPGIEKLKAEYDRKDKNVKLQWNYNQKGEYEFVLFRAKDAQPLQAYKKLAATNNAFEETTEAGIYNYAVKVIYASGAESSLSTAVRVEAQ